MATLQQKIDAELLFRTLMDEEGLPEPDRIEHGHACIRVFWSAPKVCAIIDLDEIDPDAETLEDLGLDPLALGTDLHADHLFDLDADDLCALDGWEEDM